MVGPEDDILGGRAVWADGHRGVIDPDDSKRTGRIDADTANSVGWHCGLCQRRMANGSDRTPDIGGGLLRKTRTRGRGVDRTRVACQQVAGQREDPDSRAASADIDTHEE